MKLGCSDELLCKAVTTVRAAASKLAARPTPSKNRLTLIDSGESDSAVKLNRTDTTLDLSRKAEKRTEDGKTDAFYRRTATEQALRFFFAFSPASSNEEPRTTDFCRY